MASTSDNVSNKKDKFLEEIFRHQALIHKVCRMYRDTAEDREDLFKEIVYQLWKSYPNFQGKSKISSWMYRISLNTAMATFRKPKVQLLFTQTIPDSPPLQDSYDTAEAHSREETLFAAIRRLDEDERALIALYLEDMSYGEIADIIGITENNVGVRLNRIKKKIKNLLSDKDGIRRL